MSSLGGRLREAVAHESWDHIRSKFNLRPGSIFVSLVDLNWAWSQVNASWMTFINLLLANEIEDSLPKNIFFCDLRVFARKLASPFGHPTPSLHASSTCVHLRLLAGSFDQGLSLRSKLKVDQSCPAKKITSLRDKKILSLWRNQSLLGLAPWVLDWY